MDTLDKYELIISKIQEMCTSTVAMAPYPINGISVTTYRYGRSRNKGNREGKMPTPRKAIVEELSRGNNMNIYEQMNEIANICEAIIGEATQYKTPTEIRNFVKWHQGVCKKSQEENRPKKTKMEAAKEAIGRVLNSMRAKKNGESINCSYLTEGQHLSQKDPKTYEWVKYHSYGPKFKERVEGNEKSLQDKRALLAAAQDTAEQNILMGQIKRLENIKNRFSKEQRAKMFKSRMSKLQAQINRDPSRRQTKAERQRQKALRKRARQQRLAKKNKGNS